MRLFNRKWKLVVGDIEIASDKNPLRVAFNVERDTKPYPNAAEILIWNLSEENRKGLAKQKEIPCRLEAGYEGEIGEVFSGILDRASTARVEADYVTRINAGDGTGAIRAATISQSFAAGTPVSKVLADIAERLGVGPGNLSKFTAAALTNGAVLKRPLTLHGPFIEEFSHFTAALGLSWSVQSGLLQLLSPGEPARQGPLLDKTSGLLDTPQIEVDSQTKKPQIVGRSLLRASLVPGVEFHVKSEVAGIDASFVAVKTKHTGDSRSSEWQVEFVGDEI